MRLLIGCVALLAALVLSTASHADEHEEEVPRLSRIVEAWLASPHNDREAEAFTHWNEDGEVPGACAVCHSGAGMVEYLRSEMPVAGLLMHPVPLGATVDCAACHSEGAATLSEVPFPSGVRIEADGYEGTCLVCHQGRSAGLIVEGQTGGLPLDTVSPALEFINIHYAASAATQFGSLTGGGYQYAGRSYVGPFDHHEDINTCTDCHSPHRLSVRFDMCTDCHEDATEFSAVRVSETDFDGDGNVSEGISDPISTMHALLYGAIQTYASEVIGTGIVYSPDRYPYFFTDGDGNGVVSEGEAAFPNRYQSWTPRLVRAAYNYQFVAKDPAAYVHNAEYALQLLYDSMEDLGQAIEVDVSALTRP